MRDIGRPRDLGEVAFHRALKSLSRHRQYLRPRVSEALAWENVVREYVYHNSIESTIGIRFTHKNEGDGGSID